MPNFARPISDAHNDSYVDEAAGSTNLYGKIDEVSANDADYIISAETPTADVYVCALGTVPDPGIGTGHIIRTRYKKLEDGGDQIDLTIQLREGYVDEGTPGTLIHEDVLTDISGLDWTDYEYTLDETTEGDAITDYSDLFLRFVFNKP